MLQTETSLEELLQSVSLPVERVDDVLAGFDEWCLEHVRQERENTVQRLPLAGSVLTVSHTSEKLGEDRKVKDKRCGKKRVFTLVENVHDVAATHEKLGVVLVDSALWQQWSEMTWERKKNELTGVTNSRDVLDNDDVVRMLALFDDLSSGFAEVFGSLVEDGVGSDHIIDLKCVSHCSAIYQ